MTYLRYKYLTTLVVAIGFCIFGFWKFSDVFVNPNVCLSDRSDGIAFVGFIYAVVEKINEDGLGVLWGNAFWSDKLGFNLTAPFPINSYWKTNFWILSHLFSPQDIYDFNALLSFVLIGVFAFLLLRELGVSVVFSLVGGLLLTHMDHFYFRLPGHVFYVLAYYSPILLTWVAVRAGNRPSLLWILLLGTFNALNFLTFEYYGYFGLFFSFGIFLGYLIKNRRNLEIKRVALSALVSVLLFVILMSLFYPELVFNKIVNAFSGTQNTEIVIHNQAHSWGTFLHYSVQRPLALFRSSLPWLSDLTSHDIFKEKLGEFTFRTGPILPFCIIVLSAFFAVKYILYKQKADLDLIVQFFIWTIPAAFVSLFALNPEHYAISLVPLTYKLAPMFRVSARAFLYVDLTIIVVFVFLSDKFVRVSVAYFKAPSPYFKRCTGAVLLILMTAATGVGLLDATNLRLIHKVNARTLPDASTYNVLSGKAEGLLLELPVLSPITDSHEGTYYYFYYRTKHGFPIANIWYPGPTNQEFSRTLHSHAKYLNELSADAIRDLKTTGVRYIVVNKRLTDDTNLRKSSQARLITDTSEKSMFEIIVDEDFGAEDFPEHFLYTKPTFLFGKGFRSEERKKDSYWRWAGKTGHLYLRNHSKKCLRFEMQTGIFSPKGSTVWIISENFRDKIPMKDSRVEYKRTFHLNGKESLKIVITSDAEPRPVKNADLVFNLFNYRIKCPSDSLVDYDP